MPFRSAWSSGREAMTSPLVELRRKVDEEVVAILCRSAEQGFLGGMPVEEQIDHALGFVAVVQGAIGRAPSSVADLGSGGGVPGLILCSCWPESHLVLMDGNQRRTEFLAAELRRWGRTSVEVVRGRLEELGRVNRYRQEFEVITARSFGPPAVTAECAAPLLAAEGVIVVSEPPGAQELIRWPAEGLAQLGLAPGPQVRVADRFGYQVLVKSGDTPDRYPRRVGIPSKRPLF